MIGWLMTVEQAVEWELERETEVLGGTLVHCPIVHHKSHITWSRVEPGPPLWEGGWAMAQPSEIRGVVTK
jgi:hypothetical protein